ncbi:MAG: leucine-rich repeat domain-containing protein [Firmicutes bacterium]|nr:leucine-rich repeat domain-containing protein [Bacillota bacterium]
MKKLCVMLGAFVISALAIAFGMFESEPSIVHAATVENVAYLPEHFTWNIAAQNINSVSHPVGSVVTGLAPSHLDLPNLHVNIPSNNNGVTVTGVGSQAFGGRVNMIQLTIPNTITHIDMNGFPRTGLTSVTIPATVLSIGSNAFVANSQLTHVNMLMDVTSFNAGIFLGSPIEIFEMPNSTRFRVENNSVVDDLTGTLVLGSRNSHIPSGVTRIGNSAFSGRGLSSVTIPNTVTHIENFAFEGNQLTELEIPSSVIAIGPGAFMGNQITSVIIPDSVTSLANQAFRNNHLYSVTISNSLAVIDMMAFSNNRLESIVIPNGVTSIGNNAFSGNRLTSVTIPSGVTLIDSSAFASNHLQSIDIPSTVTRIGPNAFGYNRLATIVIPSSVTTIDSMAFRNNQLTDITIPSSVTTIGMGAFSGNANLNVTFADGTTQIPQDALHVSHLQSVTIPSSVTSIGASAFSDSGLSAIFIPDTVTNIETGQFVNLWGSMMTVDMAIMNGGTLVYIDGTLHIDLWGTVEPVITLTPFSSNPALTIFTSHYEPGPGGFVEGWNAGRPVIWAVPGIIPILEITTSVTGQGRIVVMDDLALGFLDEGDTRTLIAEPAEGWQFVGWDINS